MALAQTSEKQSGVRASWQAIAFPRRSATPRQPHTAEELAVRYTKAVKIGPNETVLRVFLGGFTVGANPAGHGLPNLAGFESPFLGRAVPSVRSGRRLAAWLAVAALTAGRSLGVPLLGECSLSDGFSSTCLANQAHRPRSISVALEANSQLIFGNRASWIVAHRFEHCQTLGVRQHTLFEHRVDNP